MRKSRNSFLFHRCPKTGKITGIRFDSFLHKILFPLFGLLALLWFAIRVLPKPSRIAYPCMKVAAPVASGFLIWLAGVFTTGFAIHKARILLQKKRFVVAASMIVLALVGLGIVSLADHQEVKADYTKVEDPFGPNNPIGEAKGIFPGRVVWVHNPDATNENASWRDLSRNNKDVWYYDKNNDQQVIDDMVSKGIQTLTGTASDKAAWDALFSYFNQRHEKGDVGYEEGEEILIKINATSSWSINESDLSERTSNNQYWGISETSPHVVLTVLRHLVNVVGVPQENISIGDPMRRIYKHAYDKWHSEFPNIVYLDNSTGRLGRTRVRVSPRAKIFYSDRGEVLQTTDYEPIYEDRLYTVWDNADYVINIPEMKGHKHGGITMFAKNHFGSHTQSGSSHLHPGLVDPRGSHSQLDLRNQYRVYRVLVDMMGHELLSGNNLVYILDALWASDFEIDQPDKFRMDPFNDDYTSSLFFSLDPVAIESVGYDILRSEFNQDRYPESNGDDNGGITFYPNIGAVDDYLHQAADPATWPEGLIYDPEDDGTPLKSLGVHEHWNNETDRQYSRNLGTGDGIELVYLSSQTEVERTVTQNITGFSLLQNYPNPFNPSTAIRYDLSSPAHVTLDIYDASGRKIKTLVNRNQSVGRQQVTWYGLSEEGESVASGIYFYRIQIDTREGSFVDQRRMTMIK